MLPSRKQPKTNFTEQRKYAVAFSWGGPERNRIWWMMSFCVFFQNVVDHYWKFWKHSAHRLVQILCEKAANRLVAFRAADRGGFLLQQPQSPEDDLDLSSEDEQVANDLDMHALILGGIQQDAEPLKTADEVIQEIDDMMQEDEASLDDSPRDSFENSEAMEKAKEVLASPLYEDKLRDLSLSQLNELFLELEVLICEFSETLIAELALRDELEYEKELKNTFISLLLAVQNKRRQYHVERKRSSKSSSVRTPNGLDPKYLTTVIPYHIDNGTPDNQTLQILIKILKAINEDSPTVPTLLTDYILKVICPT
ncbi:hypothetical protein HUJ04_009634 [Dendroctonus ponderosae]|nr:hypothetical protein HUJ04_009634 [Dendroctonus ponderosae]